MSDNTIDSQQIISLLVVFIPILSAIITLINTIIGIVPNILEKEKKPTKTANFYKVPTITRKKYQKSLIKNFKSKYRKLIRLNLIRRYLSIFYLFFYNYYLYENIKHYRREIDSFYIVGTISLIYIYWYSILREKKYISNMKELKISYGNITEIKVTSDYNYLINRCIKTLIYLGNTITSIKEKKALNQCIINSISKNKNTFYLKNKNLKNEKILIVINQIQNKEYKISIIVNQETLKKTNYKIESILTNIKEKTERFIDDFIT